jgi:hypothetical protein
MSNSYIPSRDVDLVPWAQNFSTLISANPAKYGLTSGNATDIAAVVASYADAYATATNPSTRTPSTIAAKDSAKGAMVPILRLWAQTIKLNSGVSNEDKVALGIHINDSGPTTIPPPATAVLIGLRSQFHLTMQLDIRDVSTPTSRSKPTGSIGALIYRKITPLSEPTPTDPTTATFDGLYTKNLVDQGFSADEVGKRCTFWARWTNAKGQEGPWSAAFSQVVS